MAVQPLVCNGAIEDGGVMPRVSWTEEMEPNLIAEKSLMELRKRLEGEPDLEAPTESADLMRFLRLYKYDVDASLGLLRKYCAIRKSAPSLFDGLREYEKFRELASDLMMVLPRRNLHGRPVIFCRYGKWNPSKVSHKQVLQTAVLCLERASWDPAAQTAGLSFVSDFDGWSMGNVRFVDMRTTKDYAQYLLNCMPALLAESHVIREPAALDVMYALVRPFVKDDLLKMARLHGKNVQKLHEDIPPDMIPEECGGTAKDGDLDLFWTNVCQKEPSWTS